MLYISLYICPLNGIKDSLLSNLGYRLTWAERKSLWYFNPSNFLEICEGKKKTQIKNLSSYTS